MGQKYRIGVHACMGVHSISCKREVANRQTYRLSKEI